ncbi:MAG: SRPBCC domain-containing protein [Dehalococcoidia bacterium]|nr:SRPBCC domain-containing protein [Dehalococcoidia bacterium]
MATAAESPTLTREVVINAAPATVHGFLVDPEKLVRWMGHSARLEAHVGGAIEINYNGFDIMRGEYTEISPNRVSMTWGWEDNEALGPGQSHVTFDLVPQGSSTLLRLTHAGLPIEMQPQFGDGWDHFTTRLAAVVEGRDPGPDAWAPRKAELIAGEVRQLMRETRALLSQAPGPALARKSASEGWTATALGAHIAGHLALAGLVQECIEGRSQFLANATLDDLDNANAERAGVAASLTRTDVLALFDDIDGPLKAMREVPDEDLEKGMAVKFSPSGYITAGQLAEGPLLQNVREHVASLRATIA